jgi:hypothetical protein
MDSRTTASPTGPSDYVVYSSGGWSWSVPWLAGLYALACQTHPDITPELFWKTALETGHNTRVRRADQSVEFGTIANPEKLLEQLSAPDPSQHPIPARSL